MKRISILSIYILISIAAFGHQVSDKKPADKKQTVMEYVSLGNDFADIRMEMFSNGKFIVNIDPKDGKKLKLKGHWEKQGNFFVLQFNKSQVAVDKLFNMNDPNRFKVVSDMDVKFSKHLSSLWIWGIQCKKTDQIAAL